MEKRFDSNYIPYIILLITYTFLQILNYKESDGMLSTIGSWAGVIVSVLTVIVLVVNLFKDNKKIISDIGRGDSETLTSQHKKIMVDMTKQNDGVKNLIRTESTGINTKIETIISRYAEEDDRFRAFTQGQYDLKITMEGFLEDYARTIRYNQELLARLSECRDDIKRKDEELEQVKEQINILKETNKELEYQLRKYSSTDTGIDR
ncbi:MAG: hypothetical protein IJ619_10440 [Eubacterium sp.]|nr:hypothetical protein [Eubacterium sp.]